jgi:hypothetical protein
MGQYSKTLIYPYDKEEMEMLEENPNIQIVSKTTDSYDTVHLLPLHLDPKSQYIQYRVTYVYNDIIPRQSPSQHPKTSTPGRASRAKTLGDTNEFISAFWVNGKPKCRKGYRYDFSRKMCRLIK